MPHLLTRTDLLARVRSAAHERQAAGTWTDQVLVDLASQALEVIWEDLTSATAGPGRVYEEFTIATGDPQGREPGQSLPLPASWMRAVAIRRGGLDMRPGRPDRGELVYRDVCESRAPGVYWVDGPTQEVDGLTGQLQLTASRLLAVPSWQDGEQVSWVYVQQAPSLVDPTDSGAGTASDPFQVEVTIDLLSGAVVDALVWETVSRAVDKADDKILARAERARERARQTYEVRAREHDLGVRRLSDYRPRNRGRRRFI